ncbi:CoA ester lyase [Deinococcus frigens]
MLFVPGSDAGKLAKIPGLPGGELLLDLEDGVAWSRKAQARELVATALAQHGSSRVLWVRVNSFGSHLLFDDLDAVVMDGLAGINLPKVESAQQLQTVDWVLDALERRRGLEPGALRVLATIETALGVQNAPQIAQSSSRLEGLCFGAADYSRDVGLDWPPADGALPLTVQQARVALVQASASAGLAAPHDGASAEFRDLNRLELEARAACALGFGGKHAIHPAQVPVIEAAFAPTERQLAWAQEVVAAAHQHGQQGVGAFALHGVMVDAPVVARARQLLGRSSTPRVTESSASQ